MKQKNEGSANCRDIAIAADVAAQSAAMHPCHARENRGVGWQFSRLKRGWWWGKAGPPTHRPAREHVIARFLKRWRCDVGTIRRVGQ